MTVGAADSTIALERSNRLHHFPSGTLLGIDLEVNVGLAVVLPSMRINGMEGRRPGTGINFGFDPGDPELGKGHPFSPTNQG